MSENEMIVKDALERINGILEMKPLSEKIAPVTLKGNDIEFKNITHSYDGKRNVLENINMEIHAGETVALVGYSRKHIAFPCA